MKIPDILSFSDVKQRIREALAEDLGSGKLDATTFALVPKGEKAKAHLVAREKGILAGGSVAAEVFRQLDSSVKVVQKKKDGAEIKPGDIVLTICGSARAMLVAERTALNFIQRMTGIATITRRYVEEAGNPDVLILDTRKTTPTLRTFEKYAVVCGGGTNHRYGLFDRVLIKDNHLAHWTRVGGTLAEAVTEARKKHPELLVEVEVDTVEQLKEVLTAKPDWVLLDNMPPTVLRKCVKLCAGICKTEASGGVNLKTIRAIAQTGVDAISVGALTHSAPSADLALDFV
ncbi:MAG: carboxylating nicotinate-nucleotide diphosphorylase [Kiritimatiellaceae bacterium]|nr:carboxylating nicotinate-nucleotide diphosphorylase [Kiritimatiellaceae bacterium]